MAVQMREMWKHVESTFKASQQAAGKQAGPAADAASANSSTAPIGAGDAKAVAKRLYDEEMAKWSDKIAKADEILGANIQAPKLVLLIGYYRNVRGQADQWVKAGDYAAARKALCEKIGPSADGLVKAAGPFMAPKAPPKKDSPDAPIGKTPEPAAKGDAKQPSENNGSGADGKSTGTGKTASETLVPEQPTYPVPVQGAPPGMFELEPTKGIKDIEILPMAGGWEASWENGKDTYKAGTDSKGEKIEVSNEHLLLDIPLPPINFSVRGFPCVCGGGLKVKIGTKAGAGIGKKGVKAFLDVAGRVTISAGKAQYLAYDIGVGGGGEAKVSFEVGAAETEDDLKIDATIPFKLAVFASVRAKCKIGDGQFGPEIKKTLAQWTLGTIKVNWAKGAGAANLGSNPDVAALVAIFEQALQAACDQAGAAVEDAVEEYAPKAVQDAAVDAVEWGAESEGGGKVADLVEEYAPDEYKDGAEWAVKALGGGDWNTGAEETAHVNEVSQKAEDSRQDFHACMAASGLDGEMRPFRSTEEYNKIVDCWQAETESAANGGDAPGAWRGMMDALVQTARNRQKQQKAEEAAREKKKKDDANAAVQAEIDKAVAMMEAARTGAIGQGNVLDHRLKASPNPNVQPIHAKGYSEFAWAENSRKSAQSAQGPAKIPLAAGAAAAYAKAKETWTAGIHQL
jgi:hypothetical protein